MTGSEVADIVGRGDPNEDWRIDPTAHAAAFAESAPVLAELLKDDQVMTLATQYERLNDTAIEARDRFKGRVRRADLAIFGTATLGAALLIVTGLQAVLGAAGQPLVLGIGLLGAVVSGFGAMLLRQVTGGRLSKRWTEERARAEAKRLAYFKYVMKAAESTDDHLFALEYVRRYLLDNQIDYFRERGGLHQYAADAAVERSSFAAFLASTATAAAGALAVLRTELAVIAGLGVIATAYGNYAASRSAVDRDQENAARYRAAHDQLEQRRFELKPYRARVEGGEAEAVEEYFQPVFVALQADHASFLDDAEQREAAIGAMESRLDAAADTVRGNDEG